MSALLDLLDHLPSGAPASPDADEGGPDDEAALLRTLAAGGARHDADGSFPHEHFALLHRRGWLALTAPRSLGGGGAGLVRSRDVVARVARGDAATALVLVMQLLQLRALARPDCRWPQGPWREVVRSAVHDGALINALRVEPELGSPSRGGLPATIARRTGAGWRVSGRKIYSTGSEGLSWLLVWVRSDEDPVRTGPLLVPRSAAGVRIEPTWDALGLRASASHDVVLDEVLMPLDHAVDLREPHEWLGQADETGAWINVLLPTLYDALARNARDWLVGFLRTRTPTALGAALATLPRMQEAIGEIELLLQENRVQLDAAAADSDAGRPWSLARSGLLKTSVTRNAIEVVERALKLSGNHGIARRNPLERWHRDVLCGRIHTPQEDSACIAAGRAALQVAA